MTASRAADIRSVEQSLVLSSVVFRLSRCAPALVAAVMALTMLCSAGQAKDAKIGDLVFESPWSRATPGGAKHGVGYVSIINIGQSSDTLKAITSPIADRVEIHATAMDGGVMRMRKITNGLEIKAQQVTEFRPGGLHLMLIGLKSPIKKGQTFPAQLQFAKAGRVDLTFTAAGIGAMQPPSSLGIGKAGGSRSGVTKPK